MGRGVLDAGQVPCAGNDVEGRAGIGSAGALTGSAGETPSGPPAICRGGRREAAVRSACDSALQVTKNAVGAGQALHDLSS